LDECKPLALGQRLFPSEQAFPVAHVALKLELMAAGLWGLPEGVAAEAQGGGYGRADGSGAADPTAVADAMLAACGGSPEAGAYTRPLSAQRNRLLWVRGCILGMFRGCLGGV